MTKGEARAAFTLNDGTGNGNGNGGGSAKSDASYTREEREENRKIDNLLNRFTHTTREMAMAALRENDGHAGKTATALTKRGQKCDISKSTNNIKIDLHALQQRMKEGNTILQYNESASRQYPSWYSSIGSEEANLSWCGSDSDSDSDSVEQRIPKPCVSGVRLFEPDSNPDTPPSSSSASASWAVSVMDLGGGVILNTCVGDIRDTTSILEVKQLVAKHTGIPAGTQQFMVVGTTREAEVGDCDTVGELAEEAGLARNSGGNNTLQMHCLKRPSTHTHLKWDNQVRRGVTITITIS
jgi:hypothetical protein